MIPFYDNYPPEPDDEGWIDLERIYCFKWSNFSELDWSRLREIAAQLPEFKGETDSCFWWFADYEDVAGGYLTSAAEPPGWQVYGTIPFEKWREWDITFRTAASDLPVRDLENE